MELKDIVLSTLAEIDEEVGKKNEEESIQKRDFTKDDVALLEPNQLNEEQFLNNLRERILVLFEGFKAPNNRNIEAKVDLTLNFLEYLLATIDERLKDREH